MGLPYCNLSLSNYICNDTTDTTQVRISGKITNFRWQVVCHLLFPWPFLRITAITPHPAQQNFRSSEGAIRRDLPFYFHWSINNRCRLFFLNDITRNATVAPPSFYLCSYHCTTLHRQTSLKFPLWYLRLEKKGLFFRPLKSWSFSIVWSLLGRQPYLSLLVHLNWLSVTYVSASPVL
jgi:hypothetical protein